MIIASLVFAWYMTNAFSSFYTKLTLVSGDNSLSGEATWLHDTRLMLWISFMQLFLSGSSGLLVFYVSKFNTLSSKCIYHRHGNILCLDIRIDYMANKYSKNRFVQFNRHSFHEHRLYSRFCKSRTVD